MADEKKPWQKGILEYTKDFLGGMFGRKPSQSSSQSPAQKTESQRERGGFGSSAGDFVRERAEAAREKLDQRSGTNATPRTTQPSTTTPRSSTQSTPRSGATGAAEAARKSAEAVAENAREAKEGALAAEVGGKRSYTVLEGDSLSKIALRYYGDAMQWRKIYDANRDKISNPDLIYPGQDLVIP